VRDVFDPARELCVPAVTGDFHERGTVGDTATRVFNRDDELERGALTARKCEVLGVLGSGATATVYLSVHLFSVAALRLTLVDR